MSSVEEVTRAEQFAPLQPEAAARWGRFGHWEREYFTNLVGIEVEEIRTDYCRMRMPFRPILEQAAGVVHGGAIATLLDSVVVPAVGCAYEADQNFSTVDFHATYLSALRGEDAVAEGWVVKRGRTTVFCEAEILGATSQRLIARALLTYNVGPRRTS
jgi:uncharacterized protein (TIGR00369 family)